MGWGETVGGGTAVGQTPGVGPVGRLAGRRRGSLTCHKEDE
jgi:hypothetical protein